MKNAENFILSAIDPVIRAGVIIANINWKAQKRSDGIFDITLVLLRAIFCSSICLELPIKPNISGPKAKLYPNNSQIIVTIPMQTKLCIIIESMLVCLTRPP
jgi:hypothetical protein